MNVNGFVSSDNLFKFRKMILLYTIIMAAISIKYTNGSCFGCVELDEITFDKLIKKFDYTIIKFDIAFPYGDKHEAFSNFAKDLSPKVDDLLVGLIGVRDYGEKENSGLAKRYNVDESKFPVIFLFKNYSTENWIQYPFSEEISSNNLKKFVKQNSDLYIELDGCVNMLDGLIEGFVDMPKNDQEKLIEKVKEVIKDLSDSDQERSKSYLIIMKRILEKGPNFIKEEGERIKKLQNTKISEAKKQELINRSNVLLSFKSKVSASEKKDEL